MSVRVSVSGGVTSYLAEVSCDLEFADRFHDSIAHDNRNIRTRVSGRNTSNNNNNIEIMINYKTKGDELRVVLFSFFLCVCVCVLCSNYPSVMEASSAKSSSVRVCAVSPRCNRNIFWRAASSGSGM